MDQKTSVSLEILIQPLEEHFLEAVVSLHKKVLGYTLNSKLGREHLTLLYTTMMKSSDCLVAVAVCNSQPVGFVSGTLNMESVKSRFFRSIPVIHFLRIIFYIFLHPSLILDYWYGAEIEKAVFWENIPVIPILTTIGIDENFQGLGIGKKLVNHLEEFFTRNNVLAYRLDTLHSNHIARAFYSKLGFQQVAERANSVVLIKPLENKL